MPHIVHFCAIIHMRVHAPHHLSGRLTFGSVACVWRPAPRGCWRAPFFLTIHVRATRRPGFQLRYASRVMPCMPWWCMDGYTGGVPPARPSADVCPPHPHPCACRACRCAGAAHVVVALQAPTGDAGGLGGTTLDRMGVRFPPVSASRVRIPPCLSRARFVMTIIGTVFCRPFA